MFCPFGLWGGITNYLNRFHFHKMTKATCMGSLCFYVDKLAFKNPERVYSFHKPLLPPNHFQRKPGNRGIHVNT